MITKRKAKAIISLVLSVLMVVCSIPFNPQGASAEEEDSSVVKKFDFGTKDSPTMNGYTQVTPETAYSSELTYGFADVTKVTAFDRNTADELKSDFVSAVGTSFNVDLDPGDYSITVIAGDAEEATSVGVIAENIQKVQNASVAKGEYIERTFTLALVDGQINLELTGDSPKINRMVITKLPKRTAEEVPTVYIAGDSTVQTYDEYWKPEAGWGQMIARYFSSDVTFKNHAIGGRSTKTFINEGRLDTILQEIKPNDYFLVQFGHNDATINRPERYASVPDYKNYLKTYINGARQRGATPILVTPVGRRDFNPETGKFNVSFPEYVQGMKEVAEELDVHLVDLSAMSVAYYDTIGPEGTLSVFLHTEPGIFQAFPNGSEDNTHFQEYGAIQLARLVSGGIKELNLSLSTFVQDIEPPVQVPAKPTGVTASSISNAGAKLTWDEVKGADIYKVYRKLGGDTAEYSLVGTATLPRLNLSGMEEGKTYQVIVTAVNGKGESESSESINITTKKATLKYDFGLAGSVIAEGYTGVNLSTLYTAERGYGIVDSTGMIGRDRSSGGDLIRDWLGYFGVGWKFNVNVPNGLYSVKVYVGDMTGSARTTLAVEGQDYGQISAARNNYTTKIVPEVSVKDGQMNFAFGGSTGIVNGLEITPILAAPSGVTVEKLVLDVNQPSVTLTWNAVEEAKEYNIYRKTEGAADFVKVGTVNTNTFTDQTVDVGMEYQYTVTTMDNANVETVPSLPLKVAMIDPNQPVPSAPANLQVGEVNKNDLSISWDQTEGAVSYNVYRSKKQNGTFEFIGKTKQTSFKDETVLTTIPYYYKLAAVNAGGVSELSDILETPAVTKLKRQMEDLDRAPAAVKTEDGVLISWRMLGTDPEEISFNVYRDGKKLNEKSISSSTNFVDKDGTVDSVYVIKSVLSGKEQKVAGNVKVWSNNYFDIPLKKPADGVTPLGDPYSYRANDASVGDLDGDGQYELVLKWDPTNSRDNSQAGYTGNVYMDAYELDGTHLWRIDLGKNIRAGAHYSPFLVYDFDGDSKAEIAMKTADGTIDGIGKVIGRGDADHRNSTGYVLQGSEYLTVFEGQTGKALETTDYDPPRGDVASWGDSYGNRVDRFLAGVAYLDGETPSIVMARGYYTRTVVAAYTFKEGKLAKQWTFDTNQEEHRSYVGQGYHSLSVNDVDRDGKDEIVYGQIVIDDDGKGLYNTGLGHGDALHVSDLIPDRPGLEAFAVQEHKDAPYGYDMRDAETGEILWGVKTGQDTGRGLAADIDPRHSGVEAWAISGAWNSRVGGLHTATGEKISDSIPSANFAIWWDGDLLRELADHQWNQETTTGVGTIDKWDYKENKLVNLLTAEGTQSNNGTKGNPTLQADLIGDWREEIIWRTDDSSALRVYMTPESTDHRIFTLMHDPQYRISVAWQNVGYNQPPHTSFFLGEGMETPSAPSIRIVEVPDKMAPETIAEVEGTPTNGWYNKPVKVQFFADDNKSGVDATYYLLNNGEAQVGSTATIETDGKHALTYWSKDKAGNIEEKKSLDVYLDQTGPEITFSVTDGTQFGVNQLVEITSKAEDVLSGVDKTTNVSVTKPAYELGLGSHTFSAESSDVAGNKSTKTIQVFVFVDYDRLAGLTSQFIADNGNKVDGKSFESKLLAAKESDSRGNRNAHNGQLGAYMNQVKAQSGNAFTEDEGTILMELAESLMK